MSKFRYEFKRPEMDEFKVNSGGQIDGDWIFDSIQELFQAINEDRSNYDTPDTEFRIVEIPKKEEKVIGPE